MRFPYVVCLCACVLASVVSLFAQSSNGALNGLVSDPAKGAIVGAEIVAVNDGTGVQYTAKTNGEGIYVLSNLPPGPYRLQVSKVGFKTIIKPDIILNVAGALSINFTLPVGALHEIVTVEGGAPLVNTESAAVSTVIDRKFVESLPLNGRSFNTLLQLTPGVTIAPTSGAAATGQFSVAGQRTDSNNFVVDGVSANFGVTGGLLPGQSGTGTSQAFSALGGTSSLVSVEALQEFRIETSSFAPEFGRSPGGQIVLNTRAGTNALHGGVYEYFRNDVFDANDWFANAAGKSKAAERHNDFGGFVGGPISKDKTFFFLSYEGARLRLPQTQGIQVPSEYARTQASSAVAPFLDAYPQPDDRTVTPGAYTSPFTGVWSNRAALNAGSVRIDHTFNDHWSIFGRYNDAPSETANREFGLSTLDTISVNTRTVTIGANMALSNRISNALRLNYSTQASNDIQSLSAIGGSVSLSPSYFLGPVPASSSLVEFQTFDTDFLASGRLVKAQTRQFDFADDFVLASGAHEMKLGVDYRPLSLDVRPALQTVELDADDVPTLLATGQGSLTVTASKPAKILTQAFSAYAQDSWKPTQRLTLVYGLRWELAPPPSPQDHTTLASWTNVNDPASFALAPLGTPLWRTVYSNFAPRVGIAYKLTSTGDLVLRGGGGIFYDTGLGGVATLTTEFPNSAVAFPGNVSVPIPDASPYIPAITLTPPYPGAFGFSPQLVSPRSYQWNVAMEKSFAGRQALSATYVGQAGRDALRNTGYFQPNANFSSFFYVTTNGAFANYDALQVQYRRPMSSGLQLLLGYTYAHSFDNASNDVTSGTNTISGARDYASSDFDIRHSFSGAVSYNLPDPVKSGPLSVLAKDWSVDSTVIARTGFPFNGQIFVVDPALGFAFIRPNVVPGQPYWISVATAPGGKSLDPAAFTRPSPGLQGTEPRNDIQGFGLTEVDLSVAREFPLGDRVRLKFRTDAFNVFNHPNFTNPTARIPRASSLVSQKMLNQGLGGLNPIFQEGGPRSLQLSLRLTF
jgi:Carboxypeptidase regulatory-like domain/TonB dependent receptor-like, beta-barrel/TonB-dependent Receptor Plug Domain